nr:integrase, catalytic region, zinc finger, CCHC-type, peptidase aspartic, catalytic [Tanacetum cinerariifolium]
MQQNIKWLQAQLRDLKGKPKDTPSDSDTLDSLSQKLKNKNLELEFQVLNYAKESAHLKTTYKNLFDPVNVTQSQTKTVTDSLQQKLHDVIYENAKLRAQLFDKVSEQMDITKGVDNTAKTRRPQPKSNTKNDRVPSASKNSCIKNKKVKVEEHHRNLQLSKNKIHMSSKCYKERLASPKPRKPRTYLRWLPTERMFDLKGKIIESSESESQSDYSKENLKLLINFVWKFLGTIRLGNDHVPTILGYGDLQWGNILITRVYYVKSLGHNLFSIGQFCDSDLEVAFRRNTCFVRNLKGVDLLKGNRTTNLYTINLHEMVYVSPICLMARATSTKYWLSHQHLSHLNFDTINDLAKNDLVIGLLKFKYHKRLHLLHIDLCGPMRVKSINGKRYILVIVDDYSRYTWVHFIKSKGEAPEEIKIFPEENYSSSASSSHHPIATACYTQNRFIIHCRFNKTPYELINGKKSDISFLHVFGALYYPKNDREDIVKLGAKGDIGFFIAYSTTLCAYRVYNRRTNKIIETMNVTFDELSAMAFEQSSSKPRIQGMTFGQISTGLYLAYAPSIITT